MDRQNDPSGDTNLAPAARTYRSGKAYLDAAWIMTGSVALGVSGGYFLDRWLHTQPWLLVAGSLLGLISGFTGFMFAIQRLGR